LPLKKFVKIVEKLMTISGIAGVHFFTTMARKPKFTGKNRKELFDLKGLALKLKIYSMKTKIIQF
jgi:hypothetical protein